MLQIKEESEDIQVDIGAATLQHTDSHYRTKLQDMSTVKLENSTKNDKVVTTLCRGVKQEFVEIELTLQPTNTYQLEEPHSFTGERKLQTSDDKALNSRLLNVSGTYVVPGLIAGCTTSEAEFPTNLKKRKTAADYQREYRARKKSEREKNRLRSISASNVSVINDQSTSTDPLTVDESCVSQVESTTKRKQATAAYYREYRARKKAERKNMLCNNDTPSEVCFISNVKGRKSAAEYQRDYRARKKAHHEKSRLLDDNTGSNVLDFDDQPTDPLMSDAPISDVESSYESKRKQAHAAYHRAYRARKKFECENNMLTNDSVPKVTLINEPSTSAAVDVVQDHNSQQRKKTTEYKREYRARKKAERDKNSLLSISYVDCSDNINGMKSAAEYQRDYRAYKKIHREKSRLLDDNSGSNVLDVDEQPTDPSMSYEPISDVESSLKSKRRQALAAYRREYRARKKYERENMLANNSVSDVPHISEPSTPAAVDIIQDHNSQQDCVDQGDMLQIKEELADTEVDIGPITLQHMDSHYGTTQLGTNVVKQESAINNNYVDTFLSSGGKWESNEVKLKDVNRQPCTQPKSTLAGAGSVNQGIHITVKGTNLVIAPAVLQCRTNQLGTNAVKQESATDNNYIDTFLSSGVQKESNEMELMDVVGPGSSSKSTLAAAGRLKPGIHIAVEGTNLVIVPAVLQHRTNQNIGVVKTENAIDNDPLLCSGMTEETTEEECEDAKPEIYMCDYCQKIFTSKLTIINHITCEHAGRIQMFNLCLKSFRHKKYVKIHKSSKHTSPMKECDVCGKVLIPSNLKKHMLSVHSGKKWQCRICWEIMKSNLDLHCHLNNVHGQKQSTDAESNLYICDYCQKTFIKEFDIIDHITCVHASTSHKCNRCDQSFICEKYLQKHILSTHNDKELQCMVCGEKVMSKQKLLVHLKNVHRQESIEYSQQSLDKRANKHPPVDEVNAAANASTQQQHVVVKKEEPADEELELGPVVFQHMDYNYQPYKKDPLLD